MLSLTSVSRATSDAPIAGAASAVAYPSRTASTVSSSRNTPGSAGATWAPAFGRYTTRPSASRRRIASRTGSAETSNSSARPSITTR